MPTIKGGITFGKNASKEDKAKLMKVLNPFDKKTPTKVASVEPKKKAVKKRTTKKKSIVKTLKEKFF